MTEKFNRDRYTWLAYGFLAFYGYFLNILGPITPFLKDELHLSYTVSSLHFTAFAVGMLLVGLGGHKIIPLLGRRRALWVAALGISAGALLLIAGTQAWMTIGAAFFMGLVGSLILVVVPSTLADKHGSLRAIALTEANVVAAFFSTLAPLIVGWFAPLPGGWRLSMGIVALAPLAMFLAFGKVDAPPESQPADAQTAKKSLPLIFWVFWLAIVLSVSVEFCMISWSADYMETSLGMQKAAAAQTVSLFLGGMILGRMASSRLVQKFSTAKVVTASILLAAAGFLCYWLANSVILGLLGLFIAGLGVAGLYPLILSLAIESAGANTVQASARTTLASGSAILLLPLALGGLADQIGIKPAYCMVLLLLAAVFAIIQLAKRKPGANRAG